MELASHPPGPAGLRASRADAGPYRRVQGLARGLQVLEAVNHASGGQASVSELSAATGLHRTTVKRLLATLIELGFVRYIPELRRYLPTLRLHRLSDGYRDKARVTEVAKPRIDALTNEVLWSSDLTCLDGLEMVVRYTTDSSAPFSFKNGRVGDRMPLDTSSPGLAHLAFSRDAERNLLLDLLSQDRPDTGRYRKRLKDELDLVKGRGYAIYSGNERPSGGRFTGIAAPIRSETRVIGCLNIVFLRRAMTLDAALEKYVAPLLSARDAIENDLGATQDAMSDFSDMA